LEQRIVRNRVESNQEHKFVDMGFEVGEAFEALGAAEGAAVRKLDPLQEGNSSVPCMLERTLGYMGRDTSVIVVVDPQLQVVAHLHLLL
jgi:hypothetical protein